MQLPQLFYHQAQALGNKPAFTYFCPKQRDWVTKNWQTYRDEVETLASWLLSREGGRVGAGDRVAIISPNRHEWLIADLAILSIGAVSVPIYPTSTVHDMAYILEHAEVKVLFVDEPARVKGLLDLPIFAVVTFDGPSKDSAIENALDEDLPSWHLLKGILIQHKGRLREPTAASADDIATIIYTSGTTGKPKGVVHTHGNFSWALKVDREILMRSAETGQDAAYYQEQDRFFSFLPLSHVAERILIEVGAILCGGEVFFARSIDTLGDDLIRCRPTIFMCVPRLWEKMHERIMAQLGEQGTIKKLIFSLAKRSGAVRIKGLRVDLAARNHPLAKLSDLLVGRKLRNKIGLDRCRILITGAAPFRSDLMRFFASFGLSIREVYGLTENFTFGTLNLAHDINIGSCGVAFPYNEMRIANDGEIMFRAPWMFKQYYKDPQATSEALSREGWFATGDLGEVDSEGRLKIVGRKKELIKTSGGKFIAPVPIENRFKDLPLIKDVVVVGDQHKYCVALVSLEDNLALSPEEIRLKLSDYLQGINASLASFESIKRIGVLNDAMSVANGLLTPTLKVRRGNLKEKKAAFIESVYNTQDNVIFEQKAE